MRAAFSFAEKFKTLKYHIAYQFVGKTVKNDLSFPARLHYTYGAQKSELMRDGALRLSQHQAKVADAHLGDEQRRKDLDAGSVREDGEEVGEVVGDVISRQIILDDALVVRRETDGRIHNLILRGIYHHCQRRRPSKKAAFTSKKGQ